MAVPVARVHLAMAHAALPGLLPTPPEWKTVPILLTPPCAATNQSPLKPGRADAVDRWDARKITAQSSSGQSSSDGNKSSSPGRASSRERWDINKKGATSSSSWSSSSSSSQRWDRNKRAVSCESSSADRWDAHKKPRAPQQADKLDDDGGSSTGSNDVEVDDEPMGIYDYAVPRFLASPEPSMLPIPSFLVLPHRCSAA